MPSIIVFPGQGSQYVGMAKKVMAVPKVQQMFELASEVWRTNLLKLCVEGPKTELDRTSYCQPAVFVASMAAVEMLKTSNPQALQDCYATAGFSVGEYSSLVLAGALTFEDGTLQVLLVHVADSGG
jgi:[acyl-carrier-protein] S-malonyltransferase